jgi:hypothetical protein
MAMWNIDTPGGIIRLILQFVLYSLVTELVSLKSAKPALLKADTEVNILKNAPCPKPYFGIKDCWFCTFQR